MTVARTAPGRLRLRDAPQGLPDPRLDPPTIAESGDPFAALRVIAALLARIERGTPVRIADIVDRLNATYLDWLFTERVVVDALLQLQTNWMADYRNSSGIVVADGEYGPSVEIEDSHPGRPVDRPPGRARPRRRAASGSTRSAGSTAHRGGMTSERGRTRAPICLRRARSDRSATRCPHRTLPATATEGDPP